MTITSLIDACAKADEDNHCHCKGMRFVFFDRLQRQAGEAAEAVRPQICIKKLSFCGCTAKVVPSHR